MRNLAIVEDHPVSQHEMSSEVLILDDSEFDRKRLRRTLSKLPIGLNFTEGADLFTFRQQVQHKSYDLILIDYALADGDGLAAIRTCKEWDFNKDALFVMVTGNDSSALAVNALKSGFDDYVNKNDLHGDVLTNMLCASAEKKKKASSAMGFPSSRISENARGAGRDMDRFAPESLAEALQHPLRMAVQDAVARIRAEEMGDTFASLYGTFFEEDELVFKDPTSH